MKVKAWSITDPGNVRDNNEDSYYVDLENKVFVVADGVGGGDDGELASGMLAEGMEQAAGDLAVFASSADPIADRDHREKVFQKFLDRIQRINGAVYEIGHAKNTPRPMATTCEAVLMTGQAAFIAHVGDSRVYLVREDEIFRITEDHTFAEELAQRDIEDEALLNRYKHVLSRSIGGKPQVEIDAIFIDLQEGDRLLMCSDGVTDYLTGVEIGEYCQAKNGQALLDALVDEAKERGGADNLTAVLVEVQEREITRDTIKEVPRFDTMRQVDLLGNVEVFKGLDVRQILKMMRIIAQAGFLEGDTILEQGAKFEACYVVANGEIELSVDGVAVKRVGPGEHFGELALVTDDAAPYTATCVKDSRLLLIQDERFREIVTRDSDIGTVLLWNLLKSSAREIGRLSATVSSRGRDDA